MLLIVIGNVIWLALDKNPPAWDQAAHLRSIILTNQWITGKFWGNGIDLIKSFGGYPPLIYFLGGTWSLVVGVSVAKISFINTLFLAVAVVGVYKLAGNKILPAILFSLFPVIYDISRNMLLDLALTAFVVWGLYFWIKKNDVGMLIMLILASLTKLNGFIYFIPMIGTYLWEARKSEKQFLRLVIGGLIYLVAVGWWWGVNFQNIYQYLTGLAGQGEPLTDPMNLLAWQTWIYYFKLFFLQQLGPIVALIFLFVGKKENKKLIWWVIATYVIFTIIKNKDFRFTMPILTVVAVWFGWGLEKIKRQWLVYPILVWMGFNYIENSYNFPLKKPVIVSTPTFLMGDINWVDFSEYPVREFRQAVWPNEKIISDLPLNNVKVLVMMNMAELNDNTLWLDELLAGKNNLEIHGIYQWNELKFNYIILPDLSTESAPFYDVTLSWRKEAIKNIWDNKDKYQWISEYQMPKYGKVYLVKPLN